VLAYDGQGYWLAQEASFPKMLAHLREAVAQEDFGPGSESPDATAVRFGAITLSVRCMLGVRFSVTKTLTGSPSRIQDFRAGAADSISLDPACRSG
jgi:hypothetical protein